MMDRLPDTDLTDEQKVSKLCSECVALLFGIMSQLDQIRDIVSAIKLPELSTYKKIEEVKEEKEKEKEKTEKIPSFKPPVKQSLADLTMTLARNLELNLKKE